MEEGGRNYFRDYDGKVSILEDESNGGVSYSKGAWVFRMLNEAVGEEAFQKAIDLKPQAGTYAGLSTNLANSAAAQTDPKEAESKLTEANADCEKALALDPAAGGVCYKNVGIILSNKGRQKDAVMPLQKATQANPQDAQSWWLLGGALTAMMECKQEGEKMNCTPAPGTQDAYQKCIAISPDSATGKACKEALDGVLAATGGRSGV